MNAPEYDKSVTPIYLSRFPGQVEHKGSGVLVESAEGFWLFTAAHVLSEKVFGKIFLPGSPAFFTPSNNVISSCDLLPKIAHMDQIDLSYISLTAEEAGWMKNIGSVFLPTSNRSIEPDPECILPLYGTITGFPENSVQIEGREISVHRTNLLRLEFASPERLRKAQFDPSTKIGLIQHRKLWRYGERLRDFKLAGMSGGAIWANYGDHHRLVGIFTEYHKSRSLLIGTRLQPLISELCRRLQSRPEGEQKGTDHVEE